MQRHLTLVSSCLLAATAASAVSAAGQQGYRLPPQEVVELVDARPAPSVSFSPDHTFMLFIQRASLPTIADLSRPMLRLAGMRLDPDARGPYRTSFSEALALGTREGEARVDIPLPEGARIIGTTWSHTSRHFLVTLLGEGGAELWVVDVNQPDRPRRLTDRMHTVFGGASFTRDGEHVLCRLVPGDLGAAPQEPRVPSGPAVQESSGRRSPVRTYQDLLSNEYEASLFAYHATSEAARISIRTGEQRIILPAGLHTSLRESPDGELLLATELGRPFSYLLPYYSFPQTVTVRSASTGERIQTIAEVPLGENIPLGGVRTGRRSIQWQASAPATLAYVEALDGGDPKAEVPHRDRWSRLRAPFTGEGETMILVEHRASGLQWLENPTQVIATEYDRATRWTRASLCDLEDGSARILDDRSRSDRYADPGRIMSRVTSSGQFFPIQDGPWLLRSGEGAGPEGSRPFLHRQNTETGEVEELWRSSADAHETVAAVLPASPGQEHPAFITRHESRTSPPNYFMRAPDAKPKALTHFEDPTPQIRGVHKELVKYERADGVPLSATLYLPEDYREGQRLPLLVWAYPREYTDVKTASQVRVSTNRFTRIGGSSHLHLLSQGWAVLDGATMPIIGDPETMNDTFLDQLVASAQAAIDFAAERGVGDRERVAIAGHSYGAFMTANLLAHSDLFRAGVARSGAYNRTLTPFGFQSERRTFWEAPESYFRISPFMHAHKINEPLLLIHGEADNNSGTFPLQSERLFHAIKGNGGVGRLVMLPNESHGYRARESVLHTLAETIEWLDEHVVNARPRTLEASSPR